MALIARLPWYDPDLATAKAERTEAARQKAIEGRKVIERMDLRVHELRESAVRAGVRLKR